MIYSQKKTFLFTSILVIGTAATLLIHYFSRNYIYLDYVQIDNFIFTLIPFSISFLYYWFYNQKAEFIFDENYIQVFGKSEIQKFNKQEITKVNHFVVKHKNGKTNYINIFTNDNQLFQLSDDFYKNFNEIETFLATNYNLQYTESSTFFNYNILLCIILLFAVFISALVIEPEKKGIQQMQVMLTSTPEIHYGGSKSSTDNIKFKFQNFEKFSTSFTSNKKTRNYVELAVSRFHINDTLIIEIPKNFYEKKIAKTEPLSFIDKHFKYDELPLYYVGNKDSSEVLIKSYP